MKKIFLALTGMALLVSCKNETPSNAPQGEVVEQGLAPVSEELMESAVIYEANIRQYSPEGTFDAFTRDIPQLKDLGVKIIWLMPIHPISEVKRKATNDLSIEDIEDPEERKKYLGSYYSIADFTAVNPDFGTMEDFEELVKTAHKNDMYVILDWVANHTGWDHPWIEEHPDYYTQNEAGEIIDPLNPGTGESWGWTDVADLNYDTKELWSAMAAEMRYWIEEQDVDGFRADVAGEVPTAFWEQTFEELEQIKPLFLLAESEDKDLFYEAFDMGYNWEGHHIMNSIAQGKASVEAWDAYMKKIDTTYQQDDFLMNFVTNHDENSWSGPVGERMGEASEAMLALTYTIPGMPLIYSGQEYGLDRRLKFFEKDSIPKEKGEVWNLMEQLGKLKNENSALHGGKDEAAYVRLNTSEDQSVLAFERSKDGQELVYIANFSKEPVSFSIDKTGNYTDYLEGGAVHLQSGAEMELDSWEFKILLKK